MSRTSLRLSFVVALLLVTAHAHAFATKCLNPNTTRRYVPCEIDITLNSIVGNPYATIEVGADFTHATGAQAPVRVYGFLYSNSTSAPPVYRIRFNPMTEGTWNYTFFATQSSLVTNLGGQSFSVSTSPKESGFIRRDKANNFANRVVYDCAFDGAGQCPPETGAISAPNGVDHPFYWGQTYYQIINNAATTNSWQLAVTNSKAKGFRKIRMLVYPWDAVGNGSYNGVAAKQSLPYLQQGTGCQATSGCGINSCTILFNQINVAHFNTLDSIVNYLHTNNMGAELIIFKDQTNTDCGRTFSNNVDPIVADADNERYAKYVVARYAAYDNVTFSLSNEWQGTPYSTTKWNTLAEHLKPYDPFRIHPRTQNLRLMTIHSHEGVKPDVGFAVASTDNVTGWMSSASLQWSQFFSGNYTGSSKPPDQWGDEILFGGQPAGIPVSDDEFGYLGDFDGAYTTPATQSRFKHRNAMWGLATAAIYGSVGDTRRDTTTFDDIVQRSEWRDRDEWSDFLRMTKFFTDPAATVPIPEFWRMRRRDTIYYNPARHAWLTGYTNRYFVLYDAIGTTGGSITFTLPALPSTERYDVWRFDPTGPGVGDVPGTYTKLNDLSDLPGTTLTITSAHQLSYDTVFLIKALPYP
jgi:hypothetical protein